MYVHNLNTPWLYMIIAYALGIYAICIRVGYIRICIRIRGIYAVCSCLWYTSRSHTPWVYMQLAYALDIYAISIFPGYICNLYTLRIYMQFVYAFAIFAVCIRLSIYMRFAYFQTQVATRRGFFFFNFTLVVIWYDPFKG